MRSLLFCLFCSISLASFGQYRSGLVAEYLFNGNFNDYGKFSITATPIAVNSTLGYDRIPDGAVVLNSTPSQIDLGPNNRSIGAYLTIAARIKTTSPDYGIIVSDFSENDNAGFVLSINDNQDTGPGLVTLKGRAGTGFQPGRTSGFSNVNVNDGQWHCIVATVSGSTWSVYVDGSLSSSTTTFAPTTSLSSLSAHTYIGYLNRSTPVSFNGIIDDVRIWNKALLPYEITNLCNCSQSFSFTEPQYDFCAPGTGVAAVYPSNSVDSVYWVNNNHSGRTNPITYPDSGWFTVHVFERGFCSGIDSVYVGWTVLPNSDLIADSALVLCQQNTPYQISPTYQADTFLWNDGLTTGMRSIHYPDSGWFKLEADYGSCTVYDSIYIRWTQSVSVDAGINKPICKDEPVDLFCTASGGTPVWFDGTVGYSTTVYSPGVYYATVTNSCSSATDSVTVYRDPQCISNPSSNSPPSDTLSGLYLATAFTPNGDGVNDYFGVATEVEFESFRMIIYDRLGNRVFETNDPNTLWNGTAMNSGEPLMLGTYVYQIVYVTLIEKKKGSKHGYITISL